jgi:hypothetical protein
LTSLFKTLREKSIDTDFVFSQIKETCSKALVALQPFILNDQVQILDFKNAKGDCFQILGFDIFIDADLKAWMFEINDHPSLNINLEKEGPKGLIKEISEIDKYLKVKILGEAISLMNKKSITRFEVETYKGYIRILPDEGYAGYDAFSRLKDIYNKL